MFLSQIQLGGYGSRAILVADRDAWGWHFQLRGAICSFTFCPSLGVMAGFLSFVGPVQVVVTLAGTMFSLPLHNSPSDIWLRLSILSLHPTSSVCHKTLSRSRCSRIFIYRGQIYMSVDGSGNMRFWGVKLLWALATSMTMVPLILYRVI